MSKRILSFVLAIIMLVLAIPVFALPALAEESQSTANPQINFVIGSDQYTHPDGDTTTLDNRGTVVYSLPWNYLNGTIPGDDVLPKGLSAADIITWVYWDATASKFRDISEYIYGSLALPDVASMDFYPVYKNSSLVGQGNLPHWTVTDVGQMNSFRGGFSIFEWNRANNTVYGYYDTMSVSAFLIKKDYEWTYGGIYVGNNYDNNCEWIPGKNSSWMTGIDYQIVADGNITVTVPKVAGTGTGVRYLVIKNDTVILGGTATNTAVTSATAQNYANWATFGKTTDEGYESVADGTVTVDVKTGDIIRIVGCSDTSDANENVGTFSPTISYNSYTHYLTSTAFLDNRPTPVGGTVAESGSDPIVYTGNWDYATYTDKNLSGMLPLTKRIFSTSTAFVTEASTALDHPGYVFATAEGETGYWPGYGIGLYRGNIVSTRYTAPKSGKIDVGIERIIQANVGDANHKLTIEYAIYVGGKQVWPTTGDWYSITYYHGTIADGAKTETNKGTLGANMVSSLTATLPTAIEVERGETVDFLVRGAAYQTCDETTGEVTNASAYWNFYDARGSYFDGTVSYREIYEKSSFLKHRPTPVGGTVAESGSDPIVYKDGWDYITYTSLDMTTAAPLTKRIAVSGPVSAYVTESATGTGGPFVSTGTTSEAASASWPAYSMNVYKNTVIGTRYTAPKPGMIDVSIDRILNTSLHTDSTLVLGYAIYVAGEKVWPADSDWYEITYYGTNITERNAAVEGIVGVGADNVGDINSQIPKSIEVATGETVEFLVAGISHYNEVNVPTNFNYWNIYIAHTNYFDGVVKYDKVYASDPSSFVNNRPTNNLDQNIGDYATGEEANGAEEPTLFQGGWEYIAYNSLAMTNGVSLSVRKTIGKYYEEYFVPKGATARLNGYGFVNAVGYASPSFRAYGMGVLRGTVVGSRYTAPYTGTIQLSADQLIQKTAEQADAWKNLDVLTLGYAIYVGGEKVWPADGDWYDLTYYGANVPDAAKTHTNKAAYDVNYAATVNAAFPDSIDVQAGQQIEFLVAGRDYYTVDATTGEVDKAAPYWNDFLTNANYFDGSVAYTLIYPTAEVFVRPVIGGTLDVDFSLSETAVANTGIMVDGNVADSITVAPVNADAEIAVKSYLQLGAYKSVYGAEVKITLRGLLESYLGDHPDAVAAQAALDYINAFSEYFAEGEGSGTVTDPGVTLSGTYNKADATYIKPTGENIPVFEGDISEKVGIRGVSLLLNDKVNIKVVVNANDLDKYALQMSRDGSFADPELIATKEFTEEDESVRGIKFSMDGISALEWDTDFYFRVVDITDPQNPKQVSDVLCYGVSIYYARVNAETSKAPDDIKVLSKVMMALYEAVKPAAQ